MNEKLERAELEAVLASTLFTRAPDLSKILKYICEKQFANLADSIKEYNIAVDALGRSRDFRPEEDSIVRVQAARLRKHLKKYYETDGARHSVRIRISSTGYKPEFVFAAPDEAEPGESVDTPDGNGVSARPAAEPVGSIALAPTAVSGAPGFGPALKSRARRTLPSWKLFLSFGMLLAVSSVVIVYRSAAVAVKPPSVAPAPPSRGAIKIRAGFTDSVFLDAAGDTWLGDRYFSGGEVYRSPESQIRRTLDQSLYQSGRRGNFSYAIPLAPGVYELHLHFAETYYSPAVGADTQRQFEVSINGARTLTRFDIAKDSGGVSVADEKIFRDISPAADGLLHLDFTSGRGAAYLNGIEVLPGVSGKMMPVRILCSVHSFVDRGGALWTADRYFSGGRIAELSEAIQGAGVGSLSSYRTGNFDYAIPVANGSYRLRLIFAEPVFGRETPPQNDFGRRLFDIYCNGKTLASGLDIFKEAGGGYRTIERVYRHLSPDAQGKIALSFVPVRGYSVLFGVEVIDENW